MSAARARRDRPAPVPRAARCAFWLSRRPISTAPRCGPWPLPSSIGCEREQHGPVLGQDDALVALTDGNRGQKRVPGCETGRIQQRIVQRRVHVGVVTLAPDVTTFAIEERDQLDAGRIQERRVHVDGNEVLIASDHILIGVDPVAPVRAERHELRELAVERTRGALHVRARGVGLERLEARQNHALLDGVVDQADTRRKPRTTPARPWYTASLTVASHGGSTRIADRRTPVATGWRRSSLSVDPCRRREPANCDGLGRSLLHGSQTVKRGGTRRGVGVGGGRLPPALTCGGPWAIRVRSRAANNEREGVMSDLTRRGFVGGVVGSGAALWAARQGMAATGRDDIYREIERRHAESIDRLREWIHQPSIAAENLGMEEGCALMAKLATDAGFQQAQRIAHQGPSRCLRDARCRCAPHARPLLHVRRQAG